MTDTIDLKIKSGGQWLISPVANTKVFCRETFTEDHQDIDAMIQEFAKDRILPNVEAIDKLDKDLSLKLLREMGELGLIGVDAPEEYGGTDFPHLDGRFSHPGSERGLIWIKLHPVSSQKAWLGAALHPFPVLSRFKPESEVWASFFLVPPNKNKNISPK